MNTMPMESLRRYWITMKMELLHIMNIPITQAHLGGVQKPVSVLNEMEAMFFQNTILTED